MSIEINVSDSIVEVTPSSNQIDINVTDSPIEVNVTDQIVEVTSSTGLIQFDPTYLITNVRNRTGALIPKFKVVYINGATGNKPTIALASNANEQGSSKTYGVTRDDIANNGTGYVVTVGELQGINTSAFNEGDALWLGANGGVVTAPPISPLHLVFIGFVVRSHPTLGVIDVRIQNGYELGELHDVLISNPTNGQVLKYNSTTGLWVNSTDQAGTGTVTSVNASGGTGISVSGVPITTSGTITITNTAPDQIVSLSGAGTTSISGTYPSFTITSNDQYTGTVTSVGLTSATSGVTISNSPVTTSGNISLAIATASGSQNGLLSSTDWNTFNSKQGALTLTTTGTSGAATLIGNTLNIPQYEAEGNYVTTATTLTINGTSYDLSANRSWSVGTVTSVDASGGTGISVSGGPITGSGSLTITNTAPDQIVSLTGTGTTSVTGTYPSFTINSADQYTGTVTSVDLTAGTGISVSGGPITSSGSITVTNSAPDQVVSITGGGTTSVSGTYPNFTISSADQYTGTVTSIATSAPITGGTITSSGTIGITQATTSTDGYLSSTDWNTFNNKQNALTNPVTGTGTSTQITYWNGSNTVTGSSDFTWDNTNKYLAANLGLSGYAKFGQTGWNSGFIQTAYSNFIFGSNLRYDGSQWLYDQSGYGVQFQADSFNGYIQLNTATSGTGGATATINPRLRILNDGRTFLGTSIITDDTISSLQVGGSGRFTGSLKLETISNATTDTDKFLVSDGGIIKYRTGAEVLSDIGGQAVITNPVTGTGTTNYVPKFTGASTIGDSIIFDNGSGVGIGTTSLTGYSLRVSKIITDAVNSHGIQSDGVVQSGVTNSSGYFRTIASTVDSIFTLVSLIHYSANQGTFGASSTVTNQYGFFAGNTLTGATNNFGFRGQIASGTGRWNLYMDGTANNYLAGSLGIGSTGILGYTNLAIQKSITGNTVAFGVWVGSQVQSAVTSRVEYYGTQASTQATAFTLSNLIHYRADQGTFGAGSTVTTQTGFVVTANLIGAGTNYGYRGLIPSGANRWNLFMDGTAINHINGRLLLGTTTDNTVDQLQVSGSSTFSSSVTSTQFRLSALNTAPASATATGTLGEIRIDANFIYICTATNTWKRAAIATW